MIGIVSSLFLIIIINPVVIEIIKVTIGREVITGYPIAIKEANLEVIIPIKALEVLEVPEAVLGKPISLPDHLIPIGLYYSSIKITTPLETRLLMYTSRIRSPRIMETRSRMETTILNNDNKEADFLYFIIN